MEHKLAPIKREHIEEAAKIIDKEGMPLSYVGDYMVEVNGKAYHFKYITRVAYELATGIEVNPNFFQSNKIYRQKIADLDFPVYVNKDKIMIKNPFLLSDEKLGTLLKAYSVWLSKNTNEQSYIQRLKDGIEQIQKTFLNPAYLDKIGNDQFKQDLKTYISKLDGPVGIRLGNQRISNNLTHLKEYFRYIISSHDDPFLVVDSLLDGERKIEYFSKAFWSPIFQARYPDTIPNWNNKTQDFLKVLGVNVKTSTLNTTEKLRKISDAFQYMHYLHPQLNFFHLNHLMHYGIAIDEGIELVADLLESGTPPGSPVRPLLRIYEIKKGAPEANYPKLLDKDKESFYRNEEKFAAFSSGDLVCVVSRPNKEALFVSLVAKGIPAAYNKSKNTSTFEHEGSVYNCQGEWKTFAHFQIHQAVPVPEDWKWSKMIGQSETYDLWKPKIKDVPDRINKIDDLLVLFTNGLANKKLMEYKYLLSGEKPEGFQSIGLLASDSGDWVEAYRAELEKQNHIVIWWDKKPSGGNKVLSVLKSTIKTNQFFNLYISYNNTAHYRIKVVDLSEKHEYQEKKWNLNEDVAEYAERFEEYTRTTKSGKFKSAEIAFLVDEIKKLENPIPVERFIFLDNFQAPTQNNLQPFTGIHEVVEPKPGLNPKPKKITLEKPVNILQHIHEFISGKGFRYDIKDIANFYLSLKTKPFVILAGISGTGKTKLVELFAESIGYGDSDHCVIIPVKPDWTDNSDLMGYTNLKKEFEKKKLTEVILKAHDNPDEPFFIILDEMNLARVEHYFSDFLSIIETRHLADNTIKTKPLLYGNEVGENTRERNKLVDIQIPQNLYIIGTVNMDETTFPFSKKVLDRANSIEMNQVHLDFDIKKEVIPCLSGVYNDFLMSNKINSSHLSTEDLMLLSERNFSNALNEINEILSMIDLQFAYRVRDEMAFYLLNSINTSELLNWEEAFDYQVMQKILPRIQGSALGISYLLVNLINYFSDGMFKFEEKTHYEDVKEKLQNHLKTNPKYYRTLRKLDFMLRRYSQDGFTSFWI